MDTEPEPANLYAAPAAAVPARPLRRPTDSRWHYRDIRGRVRVVLGAIVVFLLLRLLMVGHSIWLIDFGRRAKLGAASAHEGGLLDAASGYLNLLGIAILFAAAICWCLWMHRAYANAAAIGGRATEHTPGWVVAGHFIPFVNLVMPFRAMKQIEQANQRAGATRTSPIGLWWAAWLGSGIIAWIANIVMRVPKTADDLIASGASTLVTMALSIVATVLAAVIIRRLSSDQHAAATAEEAADPA